MYQQLRPLRRLPSDSARLTQVRRATAADRPAAPEPRRRSASFTRRSPYPNTCFGHKLAGLADLIAAGLPIQVVTIRAPGGYDTHSDQAGSLDTTCARPATRCSPSSATSRRAASTTGC